MNETEVIDIGREAILVLLQVSLPMLAISLLVGIVISLFQAMTQIQEQTLTFAPKLVIMLIALLVLLPFMISSLKNFTERMYGIIATMN
ncbi:MAG: flagellar biosynthesis protein FliQ [Candidatus Pacebacteria bacterium]|nr:flagellar biosynthesis protein FliQ [Candidatus Paceibacterota bacterium]